MSSGSWRLFVASEVPEPTRRALGEWAREHAARRDGWRPVHRDNIHLTLKFLGDTEPEAARAMAGSLAAAVADEAPLSLRVAGVGVFPGPRRPRVLWAGLAGDVERLAALAGRLDAWAVAHGAAPETRPFRAHLTLARAGRGRPRVPSIVEDGEGEGPAFGALPVGRVTLFRSHLGAGRARYESLATGPLAGGAEA